MKEDPEIFKMIEGDKPTKEEPWTVFFGVMAAIIMLIVILGLLNKFSEWAFGVGVNF